MKAKATAAMARNLGPSALSGKHVETKTVENFSRPSRLSPRSRERLYIFGEGERQSGLGSGQFNRPTEASKSTDHITSDKPLDQQQIGECSRAAIARRRNFAPWSEEAAKMKILVEDIRLESRENRESELNVLRGVVFDLSEDDRAKIYSIFCDSAATTYVINLRWWDEKTAEYIAHKIEFALWSLVGGFNGITIDGGEHTGILPIGMQRARHFTIPGEWRDDIKVGAVYELLFKLREKWPVVFSEDRPVPLKIKIADDIIAEFPRVNTRVVKMALGFHCRAERYLKALIERLPRVDLNFKSVGRVTPEQVAIAKRYLGTVFEEIAP
jgi:hypothetical protein